MQSLTARRQVFLRSKVARRIFVLFVVCAILPLSILAFFTFSQITSEFNRLAGQRLRQSSKWAAMNVMARISSLEVDLSVLVPDLRESSLLSSPVLRSKFRGALEERFRSLTLLDEHGNRRASIGPGGGLSPLTSEDEVHLNAGKMALKLDVSPAGEARVYLVTQNPAPHSDWKYLFAEVQTSYLWSGQMPESSLGELLVTDTGGQILFPSESRTAATDALRTARGGGDQSGRFEWSDNSDAYFAGYWVLFMRHDFRAEWVFVYSESQAEVLGPVRSYRNFFLLVVLLSFWIVLFLSLNQIRRTMVPVESLKAASDRIAAKDLSTRVEIQSGDEFEDLGQSFNGMAESLERHVDSMKTMNAIGVSLSAESENRRLLDLVLAGAQRILNADGAVLYLIEADQKIELFSLRFDSLKMAVERTQEPPGGLLGNVSQGALALQSVIAGNVTNVAEVGSDPNQELAGFRQFDCEFGYQTKSVLGAPLKNHEDEIIGVIELVNARDRTSGAVVPFSADDRRVLESLASQAAVAITKNRLAENFRDLFESLTVLIAKAIDEKSPYTGAHCKRVPILSMMLADAVCRTTDGPFKDFSFTPDELYELKIAALLHDCGKVTTPVHVVDKSTKLETIFDRIHLVDTRFEIVRRDYELELLREAVRRGDQSTALAGIDEALKVRAAEIDKDRQALHESNKGSESMTESAQQTVRTIAQKYRWRRSNGEELPFLSDDEVQNLTIQRGTLTAGERAIINSHATVTFDLLKGLPYPKNLRNVPHYAASHHERMDGTGYPRGLHRHDIALQGRIIGIADVFEALTAKDRPYKSALTLSQALTTLAKMARTGHVDQELFETFMSEGVYQSFAEQYLAPEQIDQVDREVLLRIGQETSESRVA